MSLKKIPGNFKQAVNHYKVVTLVMYLNDGDHGKPAGKYQYLIYLVKS